jgi:hypothetical protein
LLALMAPLLLFNELWLMDIDKERLDIVSGFAQRMVEAKGFPFQSDAHYRSARRSEIGFAKLVQFDPAAAQVNTFEYNGTPQMYNGIPIIQTKTRIALEKTGGIMFWALDHDAQGEFSLVNAIYQILQTP